MLLKCKQFGPIKDGSIDIDKDLIILCGQNSTGKSYISYLLYGLSSLEFPPKRNYKNIIGTNLFIINKAEDSRLPDTIRASIDLLSLLKSKHEEVENEINSIIKENLKIIFPDTSNFENSTFECSIPINPKKANFLYDKSYGGTHQINIEEKGFSFLEVKFQKSVKSHVIEFLIIPIGFPLTSDVLTKAINIVHSIVLYIFYMVSQSDVHRGAYFFPAERIAIETFRWDIVKSRPKLDSDVTRTHATGGTPFPSLNQDSSVLQRDLPKVNTDLHYPLPIHDFIIRSTGYYIEQHYRGKFYDLGIELEKIIGVEVTSASHLDTNVSNDNSFNIPIKLGSSTIKSLASFIMYLKHESSGENIIFFDEPELNLHPSIQRKLVIVLAQLLRRGARIVLSTHSDFILRELNNLIMLNKKSKEADTLISKYADLGYSSENTISHNRVGVNILGQGTIQPVQVTEEGFNIDSIDDVITKQNMVIEDIYYSLF